MPGFFTQPLWRLAGVVPSVILVSVGMYEGLKTPEVVEYTIYVDNLPAEFENLRIIHLADIHADRLGGREKVQKIVDIANAQNGDLIVITGDFVDGRTAARGNDLMPLSGLSAPLGVYGVPGNHEYYSGYDEWLEFLRARGIIMLENSHVMLGDNFALGGVTDPAAEHRGGALPDVAAAFAGVPENSFKLLLAHQPKVADAAVANGVDLQLSGHTHGGMVWGLDLLVGLFNKGLVFGTHDVGNMKLHISNGTGIWNGFPIRLGHRAEICVLTLKRR
jgi:predicted MPP superfamily phosphohydrolase